MGPQEDYIETVFTCEGDFHDPHLKDRLEDLQKSLKDLLLTDKNKLILKKVEPWNSVRVTFKIPREAALRLKHLAQQGNATLRELGVLAVQIQDQNISLTIAGKNNERTQLVFRTANTSQGITPSLSVYGKHSPSLNKLGPQGPGPGHLETTSKHIVDYLRQGPPALLDLFSQHAAEEKLLGLHTEDGAKAKINNMLSEHDIQHKSFQQASTQSGHFGLASSLSVNSLNTNRSPIGHGVLQFPQVADLPSGFPPGLAPGPSRHSLDNLPPPPPYPEGNSYMNNLQKLRICSTDPSPLLVNLLQHDPNLSNLLADGRFAPTLDQDSLQPSKKKRKPRKPREKKKEAKLPVASTTSNVGISGPSAEAISVSSHVAPTVTTSSFRNLDSSLAISQQVFQTVSKVVMHNTYVETNSEQIVPLSSIVTLKKSDESDTAGKIINPVTGLLEPIENLSDISPAKSDGGKQSPHSFTENIFQSPVRESDNVVGYPVRSLHPKQSNQMQSSDHSNKHNLLPGQTMLSSSNQFGSNALCDLLHQKRLEEAVRLEMVQKTRLKNDILPQLNIVEQTYSASKYSGSVERKCDNNSSTDSLQGKKEKGEKRKEVIPQEIETKSIPLLLLNKPLLQVKHDYVTGKPSISSPDSNGDSKCSTQNFDSHIRSDSGSQSDPQMDTKTYNNDSGVGSCSERSNDTPSDHGDSDYKSGYTNSVECAKPSVIVPMKQVPPNSNIMTVGFAMKETQMNNKNHKIVSALLGSDKLINSSLDKMKFKLEQLDMCPTSHTCHSNWTMDGQLKMASHVAPVVKESVNVSSNTKSPKLSTFLPKSMPHGVDRKLNCMQGHMGPLSMQKKKASLQDSTRSCSPRNTCSPQNMSSPRSCSSSPRTIDPMVAGPSHQAKSAQVNDRESQAKSPYSDQGRSHNSEQRKSPYSMSAPQSAYSAGMLNLAGTHMDNADAQVDRNHVEMESVMRKQQQCNNDHISFLKSLEVARQLNILASTKDATFLPLFQNTQQMNMDQSMTNGVENFNTNDNMNNTSRSPGPSAPLSKQHGPNNTNVIDAQTDYGGVHNCMLSGESGPLSNVRASSNCDRDNSNHRTNSKGSKLHSEELKEATNSSCWRLSSGVASNTSSSQHQSYNSILPPPKRLTESVQKLLALPLLDTSLPHVNCRSSSSNAAITKLTTGTQSTANSLGSSQAPVLTSSRHLNGDSAHIDLDSITPSISWFGLGPIDFHVDTSCHSLMDIISTEHSCMPSTSFIDNHQVNVSHPNVECSSSTKLVSVYTGLVPSIKAGESFVSLNIGSEPHTSKTQNGSDIQIPVASELQTIVCNSESKMADNNALESITFSSHVCTTHVGPTTLQPHNVQYTVQKHLEHPKNPFQQMQLSEMLQVTENIHSTSTGRLSPFISEKSLSSPVQNTASADTEKLDKTALRFVEHLKLNEEPHNSSVSETKQFRKCDSVYLTSKLPENGENSDIPKLKRQMLDTKSFSFNTAAINNVLCDSDLDKPPGSYSNNSMPPILTAVSEEMENNSKHSCALLLQNDVFREQSNAHVAIDCPKPDNIHTEISFNKSNISMKEENTIYDKNTSLPLTPVSEQTGYSVSQIASTLDSVTDVQHARNIWTHMSSVSVEESLDDLGVIPRQLRSRKRTNVFELDIATHDDSKRIKFDNSSDAATKFDSAKECFKVQGAKLNSSVNSLPVVKTLENNFPAELAKSGLRARINSKNLPAEEKAKPPTGREDHKNIKSVLGKSIDKKSEAIKAEDSKRNQQLRRNRQSEPVSDKQSSLLVMRGNRARVQTSPVVMDTNEDFQENKRTTRSAKSKEWKGDQSNQPQGKTNLANKRHRTT